MTKVAIIEKTIQIINQLPHEKATEIADFADFVIKKYEEQLLLENMQMLVMESNSLQFLKDEEDIYSLNDLKERYND
jgi:hypothetical protein